MGDQAGPAEKGTAEFSWLMEGRWLKSDWSGSMMKMPLTGFLVMGYDNFRQSFVMTAVRTPARASSSAAHRPAPPAPTISAS